MSFSLLALIFSFTWMLTSAIYIDCNPGSYAEELFRKIGGGSSSIRLALMYLCFVLGMITVFTPRRIARLAKLLDEHRPRVVRVNGITLDAIVASIFAIFVVILYVKLFQRPIPIITGLDRHGYTLKYGHFLLNVLYKYKDFISLFLGVMLLYQLRLPKSRLKYVILAIFLSILVYFVLIGNKFSTPFFTLCVFVLPLGLLGLNRCKTDNSDATSKKIRFAWGYKHFCVVIALALVMFSFALYKYYYQSEHDATAHDRLVQRVFIKQAQMWWITDYQINTRDDWQPAKALASVFTIPPLGNKGNTALIYLIYRNLGRPRTAYSLKRGYLYTGAYPAILLELFGPVLSYGAAFLVAVIFAALLHLLYEVITRYQYVSIFFLAFVFQPVLFMILGGNMYFLMKWKFAVKVLLAVLACVYAMGNIRTESKPVPLPG